MSDPRPHPTSRPTTRETRNLPLNPPQVPVCFIPVRGRESRTSAANDAATPGGAAGFSYQVWGDREELFESCAAVPFVCGCGRGFGRGLGAWV